MLAFRLPPQGSSGTALVREPDMRTIEGSDLRQEGSAYTLR
jgi:hypothetical protein